MTNGKIKKYSYVEAKHNLYTRKKANLKFLAENDSFDMQIKSSEVPVTTLSIFGLAERAFRDTRE